MAAEAVEAILLGPLHRDHLPGQARATYQARQARKCVMQQPPLRLSSVVASQSAAYRARQVLPTMASPLRLDPRQGAAPSNWRCSGDRETSTVTSSMQTLYDQSKVQQQAISKVICIMGIADVAKRLNSERVWSSGGRKGALLRGRPEGERRPPVPRDALHARDPAEATADDPRGGRRVRRVFSGLLAGAPGDGHRPLGVGRSSCWPSPRR